MAKYSIEDTTLTAIADAIRGKTGGANAIMVSDFPDEIAAIEASTGPKAVYGTFTYGSSNNKAHTFSDLGFTPKKVVVCRQTKTATYCLVYLYYDPESNPVEITGETNGDSIITYYTRNNVSVGEDSITIALTGTRFYGTYLYIILGE